MDLQHSFIDSCFQKWRLPFMKEERKQLIEKERNLYSKISDKIIEDHNYKIWKGLNASIMPDWQYKLYERREEESWRTYREEKCDEQYKLHKDKYIQAYNDIIDICDKTIKIIQDLCNKNIQANYTFNSSNLINTYTSVKESCNNVDIDILQCDYDWIERTMPLIRILHIEYAKTLDYQRLVKFQQKANLTEEEAISIIHYLISKNLTSFYFKIGKYPENTLLVKKVMNRFSKQHDIRPEDTMEVFQEYIGNGEESKGIIEHENVYDLNMLSLEC
jgi:hypothetical protein